MKQDGKNIKDTEHGKTLGELGFTSGMVLTANKLNIEEEVPFAPLIGPDQKLTEKAKKIFKTFFFVGIV